MGIKLKNFGLISLGMVAGVAATLQFSAIAQKSTAAPLPLEELRLLSDVFALIKSNYVEPVEDKKLLISAISGMVSSLDPHSAYLDKKAFKEIRESTEGKFVGLGIEVGMEDGNIKIISPIEDSPADRAGIKAGDQITQLDAVSVRGMSLEEAVKRMRGEPKTKIALTILRKGIDKPFIIVVERNEVRQHSVKARMVEPGYAWLRVVQFQQPTVEDLAKNINALYKEDPHIKGLVLDLRNDPGGVLPGAIGVSAAFLQKDAVVVSTNGQLPDSKQNYYARRDDYTGGNGLADPLAKLPDAIKTVPMVVLVNTGSASASEIVAGALQDYKRAVIMGSQTFGKGSVQTIQRLTPDTGVKLTTARYYTPNGRSIQAKGIVPDKLVDENPDGDGANGFHVREADLQKHLTNDLDKQPEVSKKPDDLEEQQRQAAQEKKHKPFEPGGKDDFQLAQALNQLKGLPVMLSKAQDEPKIDDETKGKKDAQKDPPKK